MVLIPRSTDSLDKVMGFVVGSVYYQIFFDGCSVIPSCSVQGGEKRKTGDGGASSFLNSSSSTVFGSEVKMPAVTVVDEEKVIQGAGSGTQGIWADELGQPIGGS